MISQNMDSSDKNIWRERWLGSIYDLSSLDLQFKTWLDIGNMNPHWSFVEFMSCYFDDLAIDDNYEIMLSDGWVTSKEYELIREWHTMLETYTPPGDDPYDHQAILNDPNWLAIVKLGEDSRNQLSLTLTEKERSYLS